MSDRATCWSVTINNPTSADDENIARAKQRSGWKVLGQKEKGENGTEHYQLMVKTPQTRFSSIKKAFPRAHIEVARNSRALEEYVQKDDTRVGSIPTDDKFPSLSKLWELFNEYLETWKVTREKMTGDDALYQFDLFISAYIEKGFHIETMGVNPQIRSAVKKYLPSIVARIRNSIRQTDRQTSASGSAEGNSPAGEWNPLDPPTPLKSESSVYGTQEDEDEATSEEDDSEGGESTCTESIEESGDEEL